MPDFVRSLTLWSGAAIATNAKEPLTRKSGARKAKALRGDRI
jgi:hypothetical protein